MKPTQKRSIGGFPGRILAKAPKTDNLDEAFGMDIPIDKRFTDPEMQSRLDRRMSDTQTPREKKAGSYIHKSNIIKSDDPNDGWDLNKLRELITTRPRTLLDTNAKLYKSKLYDEVMYDITLPALRSIVVDEKTNEFVEVTTCPMAGSCQLDCYARKGGYVMFPASSIAGARSLNFLLNDPTGYFEMVQKEIDEIRKKAQKLKNTIVVRWHDAGDFFSKQYVDMAFDIAKNNPDIRFYAYTKMADVATMAHPVNFMFNFSEGAKRSEIIKIGKAVDSGKIIKRAFIVPKELFFDLIQRKGNTIIKDEKGRTQFKDEASFGVFRDRLAKQYKVDPNTIISYDQMLKTPLGDTPKWSVVVQPGAGDRAAQRKDVINSFLMWH